MTLTTKELLEKYAVRCCNCDQLATRARTTREGYFEVTVHSGPFRVITEVIDTEQVGVVYEGDSDRVQANSVTMTDELSGSKDLRSFMSTDTITASPISAEKYSIPVGPCYCDNCGPTSLYYDLPHAHFVRETNKPTVEPQVTTTRFERILEDDP